MSHCIVLLKLLYLNFFVARLALESNYSRVNPTSSIRYIAVSLAVITALSYGKAMPE